VFPLLLVCVVLAAACGADDPREYPGSGGASLEELLGHFELALPSCDIADLRYADSGGPRDTGLHLTYNFPADCLDEFLAANRVEPSTKVVLPGKALSFSLLVKEYGWPIDPEKDYDYYGKNGFGWTVRIALDDSSQRSTVFIYGLGD
jgi:hypothetical protein